jgi:hypothetical protein
MFCQVPFSARDPGILRFVPKARRGALDAPKSRDDNIILKKNKDLKTDAWQATHLIPFTRYMDCFVAPLLAMTQGGQVA